MRRVDRSETTVPDILADDGPEELLRYRTALTKVPPAKFKFAVYKDNSVKAALDKLFFGKCAYCECFYGQAHPMDVEHYRPKAGLEGVPGHSGYFWLAADWENLLPSCIDCNRRREQEVPDVRPGELVFLSPLGRFNSSARIQSGKSTLFPLGDEASRAHIASDDVSNEVRLLIDPTRDQPKDHLAFFATPDSLTSVVYARAIDPAHANALPFGNNPSAAAAAAAAAGVSAMGAVSILIYGLNRLGLVQARSKVLRDMQFLIVMATDLADIIVRIEERIAELEHGLQIHAPADRNKLVTGLRLDRQIRNKLRQLEREVRSKIVEYTDKRSPYSEAACAWLKQYLSGPL